MNIDMKSYITTLSNKDIELLEKIRKYLAHKIKLPNLGFYESLTDEELWFKIVIQFCVMGGTRMIDNLKDTEKYSEFKKAIELNKLLLIEKKDRLNNIDDILTNFKATRFHPQQAKKLVEILDKPEILHGGRIALLDGLSQAQPFNEVRDKLIARNPHFKLKSASDFMIDVGLSHDVVALDTRIVNILKKYFDLNVGLSKVQGERKVYISIEQALRQACKKISISLAQLDRMFFNYTGKNAISFIIEDL